MENTKRYIVDFYHFLKDKGYTTKTYSSFDEAKREAQEWIQEMAKEWDIADKNKELKNNIDYSGANIQEWIADEQVAEYDASGEQIW